MSKPFVVLGDSTTHSGKVISATTGFTAGGLPVAGHGDAVQCPIHGATSIIASRGGFQSNGKTPAHEGDGTSCGARLVASQRGVNTAC